MTANLPIGWRSGRSRHGGLDCPVLLREVPFWHKSGHGTKACMDTHTHTHLDTMSTLHSRPRRFTQTMLSAFTKIGTGRGLPERVESDGSASVRDQVEQATLGRRGVQRDNSQTGNGGEQTSKKGLAPTGEYKACLAIPPSTPPTFP